MKLFFPTRLCSSLAAGAALLGCSLGQKDITSDQARKICRDQILVMGRDTGTIETRIFPDHPITIDSVFTGEIQLFYSNQFNWLARTRDSLKGRTFYRCVCLLKRKSVDGSFEMYIDRTSGRVLCVYP